MADPKYANLPGIDVDGSDVFECGDLPEDDQHLVQEDVASTSVELVDADTAAAFGRFSGKYISGSGKTVSKHAPASVYSAAGTGDEETVLQKYNRLKTEVGDLMRDVEKIKQSAKDKASPSEVLRRIDVLNQQLESSGLHEVATDLKAEADVSKVVSTLTDMSSAAGGASTSSSKPDGVYQLYLKPGHAQKQSLKCAELEQRISRLEKILGPESQKMSSLLSHSSDGTLQGALRVMEAKLSLLDPEQLPQVDSRLQAILNKVNEVNKAYKGGGDQPSEVNRKVCELYELTRKWEGVRVGLPKLIERLKALNALHAKASEFTSTMAHLETAQSLITERLDSANAMQKKILDLVRQNTSTIDQNITELKSRVQDLQNQS